MQVSIKSLHNLVTKVTAEMMVSLFPDSAERFVPSGDAGDAGAA
jgi:hypothetical protein